MQNHLPTLSALNKGVLPPADPIHRKRGKSLYVVVRKLPRSSVPEAGSRYSRSGSEPGEAPAPHMADGGLRKSVAGEDGGSGQLVCPTAGPTRLEP